MLQHPNFKVYMESIQVFDIQNNDMKCSNDIKHDNDLGNYNNNVQIRMTLMIYKRVTFEKC